MQHIALAGKGSSGKTTLFECVMDCLQRTCLRAPNGNRPHPRALGVDADPQMSLCTMLGIDPGDRTLGALRTRYEREIKIGAGLVDETREEFAERAMGEQALMHLPKYDLLVMGIWDLRGSQCTVNRVLERSLAALAARYDYVVVDNEAGLEHIGRYVDIPIYHLLLVATPERLSIDVARRIAAQCKAVNRPVRRASVIFNRVTDRFTRQPGWHEQLLEWAGQIGAPLIGALPESETMQQLASEGRPPSDLPADDPWRLAAERALRAAFDPSDGAGHGPTVCARAHNQ